VADRQKMFWIKQQHLNPDIRYVFMNPRLSITTGGKIIYDDWATACGFAWAEGAVPQAWNAEPARTSAAPWRATAPAPN
jgi:hypothetical protein